MPSNLPAVQRLEVRLHLSQPADQPTYPRHSLTNPDLKPRLRTADNAIYSGNSQLAGEN